MRVSEVSLLFVCALFIAMTIRSCHKNEEKKQALDECIEEISSKCARSLHYAILLENENSRLNRVLKQCRVNEGR